MSTGTEQRKLAAIMFTDMVGYSALSQRNEALALELLEEHRGVLRGLFPKHQGTEIKTIGDGFLVEFASALAAVRCAIEIQRSLNTRNIACAGERQLQVRIGIHVGDVTHGEGDVLGDGVNIASRIEPLAEPGGICISVDVERQIRNAIETPLVKLGPTELKHIKLPLELFRIVLPWEKHALNNSRGAVSIPGPKRRRAEAATAVIIVILSVAVWFWARPRTTLTPPIAGTNTSQAPRVASSGRIEWLAVLPLRNYSGDTNQDFFVDGMTDILNGELSQISGLQVKSHTTVMHYKGTKKSVPEIGQELKVDAVVEGSVQRAGNQVLISVQLIETPADRHLWATNYERDLTDVFKLQREVARAIADEIKIKLTPQEQTRLASARTVNPAALEAYLKGRDLLRRRGPNWFPKSIERFEESLRLDPNFIQADVGLASAYGSRQTPLPPREKFPRAKQHALKALAVDDQLAEAQTSLAYVNFLYDWAWEGAEAGFKRSLALNPSQGQTHQVYARYLAVVGQADQSIVEVKRAVELDPLSADAAFGLGEMFFYARKYEEAAAQARKVVKLFPEYDLGHLLLGETFLMQGKYKEAAAEFELGHYPTGLGLVYARTGRLTEAQKALDEAQDAPDVLFNQGYASILITSLAGYVGQNDLAFQLLENARLARDPNLVYLKVEPLWDPLRPDPRFTELLRKVGLEK